MLEHPASSFAWSTFALTRPPKKGGWLQVSPREWVCEVWQSAYGHPARKRTWLLYVGSRAPFELNWQQKAGTHQVGWFDRNKPTLGKRAANATPPAFAEMLLSLASHSKGGTNEHL